MITIEWPMYRSPQDLLVNSFSVYYKDNITKKINYSLGYIYSISSEDVDGHGAFAKATYDIDDKTILNFKVETSDDAGFAKEQKYLIYLTKYFF